MGYSYGEETVALNKSDVFPPLPRLRRRPQPPEKISFRARTCLALFPPFLFVPHTDSTYL